MKMKKIEYRSELDSVESVPASESQRTIKGTAVRFNVDNLVFEDCDGVKYYECIKSGAFDGCDFSNTLLRYNHDDSVPVLARVSNGSLRINVDDIAMTIEADIADTNTGNDVYKLVEQGLVAGLSLGFVCDIDDYEGSRRVIYKIKKLVEISIVDTPAYTNTDVEVLKRSYENAIREAEEKDRKRKLLILRTRL